LKPSKNGGFAMYVDAASCRPARGAGDRCPQRIGVADVAVERAVDERILREAHHRGDLVRGRPQVLQVHGPVRADADGSVVRSLSTVPAIANATTSGASEEVRLEVRMDARLEVAVAGKHGRADEIVGGDRLVELGQEIAGVADAGRAAVSRNAEAELFRGRAGVPPSSGNR
jgi:hypothetical protein